ncbi:MAG: hypothetical protein AAFW66_03085, partial [Pseudomonadota bacterium]
MLQKASPPNTGDGTMRFKDFLQQLRYQFCFFVAALFLGLLMILALPVKVPAQVAVCQKADYIQKLAIDFTEKRNGEIRIWFDEIDADAIRYIMITWESQVPYFTVVYFDKDQCLITVRKFPLDHLG